MEPPHLPQVADHGTETVDDEELHRDDGGFLSGEADVQDEVTEPQVEHSAAGPVHDECQQNDGQNDGHHPDEEQHDARDGIARYCSGSRHSRQLPKATGAIRRQNPMPVRQIARRMGRTCRGRSRLPVRGPKPATPVPAIGPTSVAATRTPLG
jgi:hypothetical protein